MSSIAIQSDQPEASSSTSTNPTISLKHLASFVFDSSLPRAKFKKLIVPDGVVHKLVQRLMEKHGGDTNLRLLLLITASAETIKTSNIYTKEYSGPLAFLTSLPTLTDYFPKSGRETHIERSWPNFSEQAIHEEESKAESAKNKKRKRRTEARLIDGLTSGVEYLSKPHIDIGHSPTRTFISLTPSSATPLLDSLHTSLPIEDNGQGSPARRYLVVVAPNDINPVGTINQQSGDLVTNGNSGEGVWDEDAWKDLTKGIKEKDMKCSCVIIGPANDRDGSSKRLKLMCKEVSNGSSDAPWFSVPSEIDLTLSGYSIETGTTPGLDMVASTVATERIETPITNPNLQSAIPNISNNLNNNDPKTLQQLQNQAMQARMAQFAKAVQSASMSSGGNGKIDPQMMQTMIQAMKSGVNNGNIDMNDPKWQQIRQLLQLQQQRQLSASSSIPNINNNNNNNTTNVNMNNPNSANLQQNNININSTANDVKMDPNVMAAIQQQRAQQAQNHNQNQNVQQQQQQQQPQQDTSQNIQQLQQQQQQPSRPASQQIWSGTLSSASTPGSYTHLLNLDASRFSGNTDGILAQHWPKDLQLRNVVVLEVQTLTAYAQAKNCPIVVFTPNMTGQDPSSNASKYTQLANSLHSKGNMVVIPFGTQDRGIVLFSAPLPSIPPTPSGTRTYKLMGVVCLHVPFPPLNAVNVRSTPTQVAPQPQPQQDISQQQQQLQQAVQARSLTQVPQIQQQTQTQTQPFRPSPTAQNMQNVVGNNNNNNNNSAMYHQQMLLQAQNAQNAIQNQGQIQVQPQPQFIPPPVAPAPLQPQQFIQQQQQQQQQQGQGQDKRGITQQQYTQLMTHAQKLGLPIQQFDYNNIPSGQLQTLINAIKIAEAKIRSQQQQQQNLQQQNIQQQQQNIQLQQQQQQQQMVQLQQMLAQQGQFGGGAMEQNYQQ
ncbi:uncharacterized protein L201_003402 [Kwoniella dendrophila CBS 6074]|uniref:Mediator of RNA polymerase II transcription subunit 25 n=1 Tax=Kwoniella dendrophila CBS 6074 TaxID=1295534 RepID=A0AAX4JTG2_9TREE